MDVTKLDPSKAYLIGGKTLASFQTRQDRLWAGDNIQRGPGILRRGSGTGGFSLAARGGGPQVPQSPSDNPVPFGVSLSTVGMSANPNRASVYWNSSLLINQVLNNTQAITGLATPTAANAFQFDWGNDLIWLEVSLDSTGAPTAATICSYGLGNTWTPAADPDEYSGTVGTSDGPFAVTSAQDANGNWYYTQNIARIAIFLSVTSTTTPFPVSNFQLLESNLIMEGDVFNGDNTFDSGVSPATIGIVMPKLFAGPYIAT